MASPILKRPETNRNLDWLSRERMETLLESVSVLLDVILR
jgi:hypothetical protein